MEIRRDISGNIKKTVHKIVNLWKFFRKCQELVEKFMRNLR